MNIVEYKIARRHCNRITPRSVTGVSVGVGPDVTLAWVRASSSLSDAPSTVSAVESSASTIFNNYSVVVQLKGALALFVLVSAYVC